MTTKTTYAGVSGMFANDNSCKLKPMMTAREVMQILQVSRPTLRRYVQRGILKQIHLSDRNVRFFFEDVQQIADNGRKD